LNGASSRFAWGRTRPGKGGTRAVPKQCEQAEHDLLTTDATRPTDGRRTTRTFCAAGYSGLSDSITDSEDCQREGASRGRDRDGGRMFKGKRKGSVKVTMYDVLQVLKNVGVDIDCGACMEIAFTGVTTNTHDCDRPRQPVSVTTANEMPPVPQMQCPKCGEWLEDMDGFGVLAHDACGYCTHPSIADYRCMICGATSD
jgi:hypothetical protein